MVNEGEKPYREFLFICLFSRICVLHVCTIMPIIYCDLCAQFILGMYSLLFINNVLYFIYYVAMVL